ncbi:hypothetical protein GCM10028824_01270 [Hymenobacter segetis]
MASPSTTGGAGTNRLALLAVGWRLHARNKKAAGSHTGHKREMVIEKIENKRAKAGAMFLSIACVLGECDWFGRKLAGKWHNPSGACPGRLQRKASRRQYQA